MGLELAIRPFVSVAFNPPQAQPAVSPQAESEADDFEMRGSGQMVGLNHSASLSIQHPSQHEVHRVYDVLRVHNPDDDEQYVDVEVVTKLRTTDQNRIRRKYKFAKAPSGDNIEVLKTDQTLDTPE